MRILPSARFAHAPIGLWRRRHGRNATNSQRGRYAERAATDNATSVLRDARARRAPAISPARTVHALRGNGRTTTGIEKRDELGGTESTHDTELEARMAGTGDDHTRTLPGRRPTAARPGTIGLRRPIPGERQKGVSGSSRASQGPRENVLTRGLLARFNGYLGCYARKIPGGFFSSGWPDIIGCYCGAFFAVEVKRPGEKTTPLQAAELARWRAAHGHVAVATSVEDAERIMVELEDRRQKERVENEQLRRRVTRKAQP